MDAEMFGALLHQQFIRFHHLHFCHSVFGIAGVIHDTVGNGKMPARIKTAADCFRNACYLFQKINMGQVIQIDNNPHLFRQLHIFHRCFIRAEHNVMSLQAHRMAHLQFGQGRTVGAAAFLFQYLQNIRIGRRLNRKIFFKALIPAECLIYQTGCPADSRLIIQIKRRRKLRRNFFRLFFCNVRNFFTHGLQSPSNTLSKHYYHIINCLYGQC